MVGIDVIGMLVGDVGVELVVFGFVVDFVVGFV